MKAPLKPKPKQWTFERRVKAMSAKGIIMSMVKALKHPPIINIDMDTFGMVRLSTQNRSRTTCFGCAATNTICQISGKKFTARNINYVSTRAEFVNADEDFLDDFEDAVDYLRRGNIHGYNEVARELGIAEIGRHMCLPILENDYTNEDLEPYIELANVQ